MKDTIHTISRSTKRFFSGTLLSRISGMLRDMSMAYVFGTQPAIAAFMVAFRFAHLLRRLFGEGALQSAFIPEFEELRQQNTSQAFIFFRDLTLSLTLFLILLISLASGVLASCLMWGNFSPDNREILNLTLLMLPSLLFICLFGLNASLLQCEKSYFTSSAAPIAFNGIWIATVITLRHTSVDEAMPKLAIGVIAACFCQWLLTVPQTWSILKKSLTSGFLNSVHLASGDIRRIFKPLGLGIIGVGASQINNAIDTLFAHFAEPEGPALLWYAIRIQQLPLALFGIAIAGAVLPPLARALKAKQQDQYHHFLQFALYRTWVFMAPLTALLLVTGDSCVEILYGRGDFGLQSIVGTTRCLWAYAAGLLPSALVLILAPAFYAQSNYRLPAAASFLTMFLNAGLNALFVLGFGWGAVSVALATSLSAWVNLLFLGGYLYQSGTTLAPQTLIKDSLKVTLATCAGLAGTFWVKINFQTNFFFVDYLNQSHSFGAQIETLFYQVAIFGGIFWLGLNIQTTQKFSWHQNANS